MKNILKEIVTKPDIVEFLKKQILEEVRHANNAVLWHDVKRNALHVGRIEASFNVLGRMGYAVDYVASLNHDFTIETITEIQIDGETIWKIEQGAA